MASGDPRRRIDALRRQLDVKYAEESHGAPVRSEAAYVEGPSLASSLFSEDSFGDEFDYIVVGAGSAGCVIAARLSEDPSVSVLLLEAGGGDASLTVRAPIGYADLQQTELDWQFKTTPQKHLNGRTILWPRGKLLGGSSSLNAMIYVRGQDAMFDGWESAGCEGWNFKEALKYFVKSEDCRLPTSDDGYHGVGGPLAVCSEAENMNEFSKLFVKASAEAGIPSTKDYNGTNMVGAALGHFSIDDGTRCSTSEGFLRTERHVGTLPRGGGGGGGGSGGASETDAKTPALPAIDRPNLTVVVSAFTTRVIIQGKRAVGVSYRYGGTDKESWAKVGERIARARSEVIVCAGAVQSPTILMHSGIGPRSHLEELGIPVVADLPVGENLQDHPLCPVVFGTTSELPLRDAWGMRKVGILGRYIATGGGVGRMSPLQGTLFVNSKLDDHNDDHAAGAADLQVHMVPASLSPKFMTMASLTGVGSHCDPAKALPYGIILSPTLLRPRSRGTVRLSSADPLDKPIIEPNYLKDPRDLEVMVEGHKLVRKIVAAPSYKDALDLGEVIDTTNPHPPESDEYMREYARRTTTTVYHPTSTCRMGSPEALTSVVDPRCRVIGIEGLRVADASVMPFVVNANTNAAVIMIGEKAADLILEDRRKAKA